MNERDRELLSALMDGETTEIELHRALRMTGDDPSLSATWQRWHIARSAMRGARAGEFRQVDLRAAIAREIDAVPAEGAPDRRRAWVRPLASMAVAASVAVLAVLGWFGLNAGNASSSTVQVAAGPAPSAIVPESRTVALAPVVMVRADGEELLLPENGAPTAAQDRLNSYFVRHAQAASSAGTHGPAPFTRMVSLEGEQAP